MADIRNDLKMFEEFPDHFIMGIDEVGRGALAGPVMMGLVALNYSSFQQPAIPVRDSKELMPAQRESIVSFYENDGRDSILFHNLVDCSAATIDACGIESALDRCFERLLRSLHESLNIPFERMLVLLDGNRERRHANDLRDVMCLARPKADDFYVCTALASVFAKVQRDADMQALNEEHPEYLWNLNKGYAGHQHLDLIRDHGLTSFHRTSFVHL